MVERLKREKLDSACLSALFAEQRRNDGVWCGKYDPGRAYMKVAKKIVFSLNQSQKGKGPMMS